VPFLDRFFESDSPFLEDSDSPPPQAPTPLAQHSVESDDNSNPSGYDSDDIDSSSSERKWINDSTPQPDI
jgi:hypothetical protein